MGTPGLWQAGGVRFLDLDFAATAIRARQLAVPLDSATGVGRGDDPDLVASDMAAAQFDAAPVLDDGVPVGVFSVDAPRPTTATTVGDVMRPLAAGLIVSGQMALGHLMERLQAEPFLFVLEEEGITGFVTPADLGTVPVRTHFYLRLAHLESLLGDFLRDRYPAQEEAVELLSPSRRAAYAKVADDLRSKDTFVDDLSCLSLRDLVDIAGKDKAFRDARSEGAMTWRRATRGLSDFRNDVMHPTRTLAGAGSDLPARLLAQQHKIDALIDATRSVVRQDENPVLQG